MNTTFGLLALVGFCLSLAVHGLALWGIDIQSHVPAIWVLHLGFFVVSIPMIFQLRNSKYKDDQMALFSDLPSWAVIVFVLLSAYVPVNFFVSMGVAMAQGAPEIHEGAFVLMKKGVLIRQLSEVEYHARLASITRGASGHWLVFYFLPFAYYRLRKDDSLNARL